MSSYIDLSALWHVALFGLVFGAGVVACYSLGLVGASRLAVARERDGASVAAPAFMAAVSFAAVAGAIAFGLYVILDK
jgi:hypothetical protein